MELAIGALMSLCRFQLGAQWMPRRVHFCHAAPADGVQAHHRVFGPALEFGSEFDGIVLGHDDLDRVNPACDPTMARYAQHFIDLQNKLGRAGNIAVWQVEAAQSQALAALAERTMQLQMTVQDGTVWMGNGASSVEITPRKLHGA